MFMRDLSAIVRQMRIYAERSLKSREVGFPEQAVIMYLMSHGTSNQCQIAEAFGIDQGAIAKTISKLESKRFITRRVNPDNRREKIIDLDPSASALKDQLVLTYANLEAVIFEGITEEERSQFEDVISKMAQNSLKLLEKEKK